MRTLNLQDEHWNKKITPKALKLSSKTLTLDSTSLVLGVAHPALAQIKLAPMSLLSFVFLRELLGILLHELKSFFF